MFGNISHPRQLKATLLALIVGIFFSGVLFTEALASKSGKATEVSISLVDGIAVDAEGNIYISRRDHNVISKIDKQGMISRFAGSGASGFSGDGGPATKATFRVPAGLAFDAKGNLYIADRENHRVRKVDSKGIITTIAGTGTAGFSGDGGPAVKAQLNLPSGIVVDPKGNIFIADRSNDRIRVIDPEGNINTYAGTGEDGFFGDAGPASKAKLSKPFGVALDKKGNLFIADRGNNRVRRVTPKGIITTVAGDGGFFFMGDNGPAYRASVAGPTGVAVDHDGNLIIADRNNNRIRMVDTQGLIRTVFGTGQQDYNGDSELARETNLHLPFGVAIDNDGKLLVIDRSHYRIRRTDLKTGKVNTVAGNGVKKFMGDGGPATGARLSFPHGIVVDSKDNVIFSDKSHNRLRMITPDGIIDTIAGTGNRGTLGDGGPAIDADLYVPTSLLLNEKDEIFLISPSGFVSVIRKINSNGIIDHYISTADEGYMESIKNSPRGQSSQSLIVPITNFGDLAYGGNGILYVSDPLNHQIRKIDKNKKVTTIAGTGDSDYTGDGGPAEKANFRDPNALVVDSKGNLLIGDSANNRIRMIDTKGIVSTIAGNGEMNNEGDGGPALEGGIRHINDLAFSPSGELHIVGSNSHLVRKITKDGKLATVAGRSGIQGFFGDGGPATKAMLKNPIAIAFDSKGNLYISDMGNNRIRKVDTKGIITTVAGTGAFGWAEEGEKVEILFQNFP